MTTRAEVAVFLSGFYTCKMGGPVSSDYDETKRQYYIHGEGLPAHPDLRAQYPNGWSMLDYIPPAKARALMAGRVTL